ncbi:hypothetical protein FHT00_001846 [Sphingomonas insulae]|uniref:Uncharacterized protein n=1 Tax=Sphingomonas insulae TaxID=424800 RepID=A0ABN1HX84_9SPHN|nr:hypothetical protein [Sphingomonas insulae]NIJ29899.1 hypothetical protein [Sphingomonas insulae]
MAKRRTSAPPATVAPSTGIVLSGRRIEKAYSVPDLQPKTSGPWRREHDKLAWTDPATGLDCIVRRMNRGHLGAFVAVRRGHPLFGYSAGAIPPGLLRTHGGVDYAEACDDRGPEDRSICHVHSGSVEHVDDAWWIGTTCDQITDLVPDDIGHATEARRLGIDQVYRDEAYAIDLCTDLARDLTLLGEVR